ncbi:MAG: histidine kinase dimerization/phospho-acceptor domain-containing protein [Minicystis sp.]
MIAAREHEVGYATRAAPRSLEETHYVAVLARDGMVVRLGAPLSGIEGTLQAMRRRLLFAVAIAVAAALALGLVASRIAARPLRAMTAVAARIAEGDYDVEISAASPDEFGLLSRTLASLAAALERDVTQIRLLSTMRRDFVANVSHELRTPVTAIQGYAETLIRGPVEPKKRDQFLEIIHRHALRIGRLIQDLLRLSELEARPPEAAVREPVPLAALAGHVVETFREKSRSRRCAPRWRSIPISSRAPIRQASRR